MPPAYWTILSSMPFQLEDKKARARQGDPLLISGLVSLIPVLQFRQDQQKWASPWAALPDFFCYKGTPSACPFYACYLVPSCTYTHTPFTSHARAHTHLRTRSLSLTHTHTQFLPSLSRRPLFFLVTHARIVGERALVCGLCAWQCAWLAFNLRFHIWFGVVSDIVVADGKPYTVIYTCTIK